MTQRQTYVTTQACSDGTFDGAAWLYDGDYCINIIVGLSTRGKARYAALIAARKFLARTAARRKYSTTQATL